MGLDQMQQVLCECNSFKCLRIVLMPRLTYEDIAQKGLTVIVDGCSIGPSKTDHFVEKRDGYALYRRGD